MRDPVSKNLGEPDETVHMPGVEMGIVDLGDLTVARAVHQPGWRWSTHVRPSVGGDWCQVRHVGLVLSGRLGFMLEDGTSYEVGPNDVYEIPPGHDGYVIGHEPAVMIEWAGIRAFTGFMGGGMQNRVLATLVRTNLVGSEARARELGDNGWRELLSSYLETVRGELERFRGNEVATGEDGLLLTFSSAAHAIRCAGEIRRLARASGLTMRAAVHVGEVEMVGPDVRGITVQEIELILAAAAPEEILVSDTTRILAAGAGLGFDDRGTHVLDGLGERHLFAYTETA